MEIDIRTGCPPGICGEPAGGVEDEAGSEISAPHQTHLPVVGDLNASCRHSSVITGSSLSSRPTLDKAEGSELKP